MMLREILWEKGEALLDRMESKLSTEGLELPYGVSHIACDKEEDLRFEFIQADIDCKMLDIKKAKGWMKASAKYGEPGPSILPSSTNNRILILSDYEKLYRDLVKDGERAQQMSIGNATKRHAHALILGNSGIGKSVSLSYFLIRRLLEGRPTLFRSVLFQFLYTRSCVIWDNAEIEKELGKLKASGVEVWVLCDRIAPLAADRRLTNTRLIEATSMEVSAYEEWAKAHNPKRYFVDMWEWEELYFLKEFYSFPLTTPEGTLTENQFVKRLWLIYYMHNGEPRLVTRLQLFSTGDEFHILWRQYQERIKRACTAAALRDPSGMFRFDEHNDSHVMIASRPPAAQSNQASSVPLSDKRPVHYADVPENEARTPWVGALFARELVRVNRYAALDVMDRMIHFSAGKSFAGHIKELVDHELVEKKPFRKLVSRREYLGTTATDAKMDRRTSFEKFFAYPKKHSGTFFDTPEHLAEFITDANGSFERSMLGVYFRPSSWNCTSIDAVLFYESTDSATSSINVAYLQHTVGTSHPVKIAGLERIHNILPIDVRKPGRGYYGILAFVLATENFIHFGKQSYSGGTRADAEKWSERLVQVKICIDRKVARRVWGKS